MANYHSEKKKKCKATAVVVCEQAIIISASALARKYEVLSDTSRQENGKPLPNSSLIFPVAEKRASCSAINESLLPC